MKSVFLVKYIANNFDHLISSISISSLGPYFLFVSKIDQLNLASLAAQVVLCMLSTLSTHFCIQTLR